MIAPVTRLRKKEVDWLGTHRCKHHHTFLEHYDCYLKERPDKRFNVGFFDLECSNLAADFGIILCYCIKEFGTKKIYNRTITKKELATCMDENVVRSCIKDLSKFDKIVTYYGTGFDFPFIRTRATALGVPFPEFGQIYHRDIYYIIRHRFRLSRNRLDNACRTLLGKTKKTYLEPKYWIKALQGDKKSLEYILDHCKRDVEDLEDLYNKTIMFIKDTDKSA